VLNFSKMNKFYKDCNHILSIYYNFIVNLNYFWHYTNNMLYNFDFDIKNRKFKHICSILIKSNLSYEVVYKYLENHQDFIVLIFFHQIAFIINYIIFKLKY